MKHLVREAIRRIRSDGVHGVVDVVRFGVEKVDTALWHAMTRSRIGDCGRQSAIVRPRRLLNPRYISLGAGVTIRAGARIEAIRSYRGETFQPRISIGSGTQVEYDLQIECAQSISIGSNVLIAGRVFISDLSHGAATDGSHPLSFPLTSDPVTIGDGTWIGQQVCILPGVTLGNGCIVGANAVVTTSFGDGSIIGGVPARLIRQI